MSNHQITDQELLERFKQLAIQHDKASEVGDYKNANRCVDEINRIVLQLWRTKGETKEALKGLSVLASSDDPRIALMAVTYTIELYPEVANELKRLKRDKSLVGLGAKYALENWKKGKLKVLKELLGL